MACLVNSNGAPVLFPNRPAHLTGRSWPALASGEACVARTQTVASARRECPLAPELSGVGDRPVLARILPVSTRHRDCGQRLGLFWVWLPLTLAKYYPTGCEESSVSGGQEVHGGRTSIKRRSPGFGVSGALSSAANWRNCSTSTLNNSWSAGSEWSSGILAVCATGRHAERPAGPRHVGLSI